MLVVNKIIIIVLLVLFVLFIIIIIIIINILAGGQLFLHGSNAAFACRSFQIKVKKEFSKKYA